MGGRDNAGLKASGIKPARAATGSRAPQVCGPGIDRCSLTTATSDIADGASASTWSHPRTRAPRHLQATRCRA